MFERFTQRARQAVVSAQDEARDLGHSYIGTEHLLLGLLAGHQEALGRVALNRLGVTLERSRSEIVEMIGRGDDAPSGHIPFTSRAKKVLELSLREALNLGHNYIGTEHIVLGLVREGEGVAMQAVQRQGVSGERVREEVLAEVGRVTEGRGAPRSTPVTTPGAESVLAAARELAGDAPLGTHHLLEALSLAEGSVAGGVLGGLGIDAETVAARIDATDVDGTSDVTPELVAARQLEVHLDDDAVRIVLGDDTIRELVGRLVESLGNPMRGSAHAESLIALWRANVAVLQQIAERIATPDDTDAAAGSGQATSVRAAIRARLRRRHA
jgi:hypothetical protein